ncbi:MAG: ATP-dependent DNA helicase RecG [Betaproteobacteria bacterium]|jgi:ATP-dependent DNA helicase RecG|nr:ATP-dependent DNA helicase RecG [Polynucleobacter sp.]NBY64049.1 ATP-dependent DNA helicase RecG [Betaproteobacteria bacterium]
MVKPTSTAQIKAVQTPLSRLGLDTPAALALHLPMRYEDETTIVNIAQAIVALETSAVQTQGHVIRCEVQFRPRRQLVVLIADETDELTLRFLNFYPSQQKQMAVGMHLRVRGDLRQGYFGPEMVHPTVKVCLPDAPLSKELTPIYSTIAGLGQATLRKAIEKGLKEPELKNFLEEIFTPGVICQNKYPFFSELPSLEEAIRLLHHPDSHINSASLLERTHPAWRRVQFEELLAQQISLQQAHMERKKRQAPAFCSQKNSRKDAFLQILPFQLTQAQLRVWGEITSDLEQAYPMNRLLQGDVGSGKTAIAALAACYAIENGYQVALMAPTEILAEQHYQKFLPWFTSLGISIVWLTGSLKVKEKRLAQEQIMRGDAQLAIGTHALIQEGITFANLGLAIIDEQHRFGVRQRLQLHAKKGTEPVYAHQLMMSATPIPRTLAMTYYADLEVSVIDELPPGRKPVVTKLIKENRRPEVVVGVQQELAKGRQCYWVCPLIEESEVLQLKTALETFETLSNTLSEYSVGLIHGKLKAEEKSSIMARFKDGQIQLLVSTTVIEVGVDVPNATLMVIEHAQRFGYAQIHQLRGRVGRGAEQSVCILLYSDTLSSAAKERLQTLRKSSDGFEIAEKDLALRGPGELLGARQSGDTMLRFVDLQRDAWLIEAVKDLAHDLLQNEPQLARKHLVRWLGSRSELLKA